MTYQRNEFAPRPLLPLRGFTSIEAAEFLRREFPEVEVWTCWTPEGPLSELMVGTLAGRGYQERGEIAGWRWERVPSRYPAVGYTGFYEVAGQKVGAEWVGVLRVRAPGGEELLLFSFLSSSGGIGGMLLASTSDLALLERLERDVTAARKGGRDQVVIDICNGPDIRLPLEDSQPLFLPATLVQDVTAQVESFFENPAVYARMGIRRRRGLLFVGPPGNGKTLMIKRLARLAYRRFEASLFSIATKKDTDGNDLERMLSMAGKSAPAVIILEDLDSLTRECQVTRAGLLSKLDGMDPREGILILATTNNPEDVDPALIHRPSRFDRVYHFELPDLELRRRYLDWALPQVPAGVRGQLAEASAGWSFAYLNELRVTAAILAIREGREAVRDEDVGVALEMLAAQFKAGRQNHKLGDEGKVGFASGGKERIR